MTRRGLLALAPLLALAGCGTVTSLARGPEAVPYEGPPVYSGVRSAFLEQGAVYGSDTWMFGIFAWIVIGIDGAISAALDTGCCRSPSPGRSSVDRGPALQEGALLRASASLRLIFSPP